MPFKVSLDARGLLTRQRRGASERVVLVGARPLAQAVKSFERADPITLPCISSESRFDLGNVIGQLIGRFFLATSRLAFAASPLNSLATNEKKTYGTQGNIRT